MKNIQSVCENLLKPVKIVEGIVEKRQTLPILSNILIEQNGENVKFSATDLDIQISTEAPSASPASTPASRSAPPSSPAS